MTKAKSKPSKVTKIRPLQYGVFDVAGTYRMFLCMGLDVSHTPKGMSILFVFQDSDGNNFHDGINNFYCKFIGSFEQCTYYISKKTDGR